MERVIITTGGTGGHIFPALAVAEEIRHRYPEADILFLGSTYGQEMDLAAQAGIPFAGLPVRGVLGRGVKAVGALAGIGLGVLKARRIVRRMRPQVVAGFGSYAAFSGLLAARMVGIPTLVHEQNSIPGLTNRYCGSFAGRVCLSMPDTRGAFTPAGCVLTGNPVRASIAALHQRPDKTASDFGRRILVLGGSLGARALNDAIIALLPQLIDADITVWHQTGRADCERVREAYRQTGAAHMRVEAFIGDMAAAYAWADLALCRAGATTVAELACAALPALYVPFPHATHDHQTHNARDLEAKGCALVLPQAEMAADPQGRLLPLLTDLLADPARLAAMGQAAGREAHPDAAARVVDQMEILAGYGPQITEKSGGEA